MWRGRPVQVVTAVRRVPAVQFNMREGMGPDFVAAGGDQASYVGKPPHVRAHLEEGRRYAAGGEGLENGRRGPWVGTVVEGQVADQAVAAPAADRRSEHGAVGIVRAPEQRTERERAGAGRPDQGNHGEESRRRGDRSNGG